MSSNTNNSNPPKKKYGKYDFDNPKYGSKSPRGPSGAPNLKYASPRGQSIRSQQNWDHMMKSKRLKKKQMAPLNNISAARGDKEFDGSSPIPTPNQTKVRIRRKSPDGKYKGNAGQSQIRSATFNKMKPTKMKPSVCISFSIFLFIAFW